MVVWYISDSKQESEQSSPFRRWTTGSGAGSSYRHHDHRGIYTKQMSEGSAPSANNNGSCGGVARWSLGLEQLLADPAGTAAFAHFLSKEFAAENIRFWWSCEQYRCCEEDEKRNALAQEIWQRHLAEGASEPVNVDAAARRAAALKLHMTPPPQDLFAQCRFDKSHKRHANMSRKDKILSLALADKENDGPHSVNQTLQKEKTPLQDITTRSHSRSSSSSSSSSSNSSSSTTSSSSTSSSNSPQPNVNTSETQEIQKTERKKEKQSTIGMNRRVLYRRHRSSSSNFSNTVDFSPDDNDPDYCPLTVTHRTVDESSDIDSEQSENIANSEFEILVETSPTKKRRKGVINSKKLAIKTLRNSGKQYTSLSKNNKVMSKRALKSPCGSNCRLKCSENINQEEREQTFQSYWEMGSLTRQRDFIASNMTVIKPKYQYKKEGNNRKAKHAFYFTVKGKKIRICKTFFRNTLDINDRPIRTVIEKMTNSGIVEEEKRGKHGRQKRVTDDIIQGIKSHIESIPRIESHYLRQQTSREYIDGGKI
ncbi:unnamed protein product [Euphydryas editha]|uniref:RGS domain-containing protein n=1 Tax=Euphydryas editha TaxID=104508 RepID=A0AAU9UCP8_EUPED|nr:unnamed protein product [Euphydryas editha]